MVERPGSGLTYGYSDIPGKGGRFIIAHIGSENGFVPDCLLLFRGRKDGDYHEEMDGARFQDWFLNTVVPKLPQDSVVVMDNAPYHSKLLDSPPPKSARVGDIEKWLTEHGIPWEKSKNKKILYANYVEPLKKDPQYTKYALDEEARKKGVEILRLPPYHCCFNPIELIWGIVKTRAGKKNVKKSWDELEALLKEEFSKITAEDWAKSIQHTRKIIEEYMKRDGFVALTEVAPLVIENDDDEDDDDDEDFMSFYPQTEEDVDSIEVFNQLKFNLNCCISEEDAAYLANIYGNVP